MARKGARVFLLQPRRGNLAHGAERLTGMKLTKAGLRNALGILGLLGLSKAIFLDHDIVACVLGGVLLWGLCSAFSSRL